VGGLPHLALPSETDRRDGWSAFPAIARSRPLAGDSITNSGIEGDPARSLPEIVGRRLGLLGDETVGGAASGRLLGAGEMLLQYPVEPRVATTRCSCPAGHKNMALLQFSLYLSAAAAFSRLARAGSGRALPLQGEAAQSGKGDGQTRPLVGGYWWERGGAKAGKRLRRWCSPSEAGFGHLPGIWAPRLVGQAAGVAEATER